MLLTDDEIDACIHGALNRLDVVARTQAAILAKLGAMELPEPVEEQFQTREEGVWHNFIDEDHRLNTKEDGRWPMRSLYTAAQFQQAYAQGAAAQLAERPSGYLSQYNLEMLQQGYPQTIVMLKGAKRDTPLYTRREAK